MAALAISFKSIDDEIVANYVVAFESQPSLGGWCFVSAADKIVRSRDCCSEETTEMIVSSTSYLCYAHHYNEAHADEIVAALTSFMTKAKKCRLDQNGNIDPLSN